MKKITCGLGAENQEAISTTLTALENAGASLALLSLIARDEAAAKSMVEAGNAFLQHRYADEETESIFSYPDDYSVVAIEDQISTLAFYFGLDAEPALEYAKLLSNRPDGVLNLFAIPKWQAIACSYPQAVEAAFMIFGNTRKINDWEKLKFNENNLRQTERTEQMFAQVCNQQPGDICVIYAQFGLEHRGRGGRRAREVLDEHEFGLGLFAVTNMLLTHPERERDWDYLHVMCAGDQHAPNNDGNFVNVPAFSSSHGILSFESIWEQENRQHYGSASGFVCKN